MTENNVGAAVIIDPDLPGPDDHHRARPAAARQIVVEGPEVVGILSMRDIVRCWVSDGATCDTPA